MEPYSHGALALLALVSGVYLLFWRKNFTLDSVKEYFFWFALFFLYNATLATAAVFFPLYPVVAATGYILALFVLALGAWHGFRIGLRFLNTSKSLYNLLSKAYITGVLAAVFLHVLFFELPQVADENWLFWYTNRPVSLFYALFMFIAGWTVSFSMLKAVASLVRQSFKIRALLIAGAAFLLPIAAIFFFGVTQVSHIVLSLWLVGIALVLFLVGNILPGLARRIG